MLTIFLLEFLEFLFSVSGDFEFLQMLYHRLTGGS
jgi:hypothetical protein